VKRVEHTIGLAGETTTLKKRTTGRQLAVFAAAAVVVVAAVGATEDLDQVEPAGHEALESGPLVVACREGWDQLEKTGHSVVPPDVEVAAR